ncbi:23S rRNA (uracil(1939)-C(5))-methyltransferase RlmD [Microaerobacter geothermalis]|uniref:23S rRNA (uracil(1939)-C(5))-methyltransferase RlmD n=1 Tax=Microaerobacter geothermalis TaxID=674972 RepID=UPI002E348C5C|nr:23S rRNA (uracil(1939)-C(5))-methyltransferase RlmD [Microaerobacter geothermalis]
MKKNASFKIGQMLSLPINRLGINGEGIGYYQKQVVFVQGALPGERVKVKITNVKPTYAIAKLLHIEKKSAHRITPACSVYEQCGGCQLQHVQYEEQLRFKRELVVQSFQRYTKIPKIDVKPTIGMKNPWGYRNKAQLQVGMDGGEIMTGLYSPGSHRLVDISGCPIQDPKINEMIRVARGVMKDLGIPIYQEKGHRGVIRTIVARIGMETGEGQITFVTRTKKFPKSDLLIARLREKIPYLKSIHQNINDKRSSIIFGEETILLWGREKIKEQLGNVDFSLSPRAFFQLNPEQTIKLYEVVKEAAQLTGGEKVVDAYCGVGTIGLWLAPLAKEVRGMDVIPESIDDARRNATTCGFSHANFYVGKAEILLPQWVKEGWKPDVIVVDPPRTGCDEKLLKTIIQVKPKHFVYVSCNPSTLAKDCRIFHEGGFDIEWVQPVDMFPQTAHVECVVLMQNVKNK